MRNVKYAGIQMQCSRSVEENIAKADKMVREAAANGAQIILLPELFERQYFCQERNYDYYAFATPEYNHTIPAPLASALEWIAYTSRVLVNKPVMIVGCSLGALGTSRAQAHLRQILDAPELKARVMPGTEFFLGHSEHVLDDDFNLNNPEKVAELEEHFTEFQDFVIVTNQIVKQADTDRKKAFVWEAGE